MTMTRITGTELKAMRSLTMACWWPFRVMGRTVPDWSGIAGEFEALLTFAERRPNTPLAELDELRKYRQMARDRARGY